MALRECAAQTEAKLGHLYHAMENGALAGHDPTIRRRIAELTTIREQAQFDADRIGGAIERTGPAFATQDLRALTLNARQKLRNGDRTSPARIFAPSANGSRCSANRKSACWAPVMNC